MSLDYVFIPFVGTPVRYLLAGVTIEGDRGRYDIPTTASSKKKIHHLSVFKMRKNDEYKYAREKSLIIGNLRQGVSIGSPLS